MGAELPLRAEDLAAFLGRLRDGQEDVEWLVRGLIPAEGIALWHGQPRSMKSLCALEAALALATGRPAFHAARFAVTRRVKTLVITEEDSETLVATRLRRWLRAGDPPPPETFFVAVRRGLSFDEPDALLRLVDATSPGVVLFDPLRGFTGQADRGPADLRPVVLLLRRIQRTTSAKALVLVHHDAKPPVGAQDERPRAQQASGGGIFSIADCPVQFRRLDWNRCAVFPSHYKVSSDPPPFEVVFETDVRDVDGAPAFGSYVRAVAVDGSEHDLSTRDDEQKVARFLRERAASWVTLPDIAAVLRMRPASCRTAVARLVASGVVDTATGEAAKAAGRSPKARLYRWRSVVPDAGRVDSPTAEVDQHVAGSTTTSPSYVGTSGLVTALPALATGPNTRDELGLVGPMSERRERRTRIKARFAVDDARRRSRSISPPATAARVAASGSSEGPR